MCWIKQLFTKRRRFILELRKGSGLTSFVDHEGKHLELFKTNKIFIKEFLKLSTKRNSYLVTVSNKHLDNSHCIELNDSHEEFRSYLKYRCNGYTLEFCTGHLLKYFNNNIPSSIYITVNKN